MGSSTMPQKVNPILLENAEGNAELAASRFAWFVKKFSHTRLQRDLSDSTVRRTIGEAYGHLYLSLHNLTQGLDRLEFATEVMKDEVATHPEVLAEAVQIIMRREGRPDGYEQTKEFFRGHQFDQREFTDWLQRQDLPDHVYSLLLSLDPLNYTGLAEELVREFLPVLKSRIANLI